MLWASPKHSMGRGSSSSVEMLTQPATSRMSVNGHNQGKLVCQRSRYNYFSFTLLNCWWDISLYASLDCQSWRPEEGQVGRAALLTSSLLRPLYSLRQCQIVQFRVNQSNWEKFSSGTCHYSFPVPFQCPMKGEPVRRSKTDHWHLAEEGGGFPACADGKVVVLLRWSWGRYELDISVCFPVSPEVEGERCILTLLTRTLGQWCSLFDFHAPMETLKNIGSGWWTSWCWVYWACSLRALDF